MYTFGVKQTNWHEPLHVLHRKTVIMLITVSMIVTSVLLLQSENYVDCKIIGTGAGADVLMIRHVMLPQTINFFPLKIFR